MKAFQFRFVDLLVLIAAISLAAGVLVPAMNQPRINTRRMTCQNNIFQTSLGLLQYEKRHGHFPGYVNPQAETCTEELRQATRPVGWVFSILHYLERSDLVECYGSDALQDADVFGSPFEAPRVFVKMFLCPSDPRFSAGKVLRLTGLSASSSYVVNCGLKDLDPPAALILQGQASPRDRAANGVFHFNYPFRWATDGAPYPAAQTPFSFDMLADEPIVRVSVDYIARNDGTANTLMLSENVDAGNWTDALEHQVGFVWQAASRNGQPVLSDDDWLLHPLRRINDDPGGVDTVRDSTLAASYARPSSFHVGIVNAVYADGHAEPISEAISYAVYCQLMTPCGAEAKPVALAVDASVSRK